MAENVCLIDSIPDEVLERIISNLSPMEIRDTIRNVNHRFRTAGSNVLFASFKCLGPVIIYQLNKARGQLILLDMQSIGNQETEMVFVAQYTFLQIMHSEYRILSDIFLNQQSTFSDLEKFSVEILEEFQRLLSGSAMNQQDWRFGNVSTVMNNLRDLNSKIIDLYFWKYWNFQQEHFGPFLLRLMDCSLCAKYNITVTHEADIKSQDSKCQLFGRFEIPDLSHTLISPPAGLQESGSGIIVLICYICDAIRWSNMFHTLRLRWVCMDRALAIGRRPVWSLLDDTNPYINNMNRASSETVRELRNGEKKICRIIKRSSEDPPLPTWVGIKCEFQLWCPLSEAPLCLMGEIMRNFEELPETSDQTSSCTRPYHFKMEFKSYVKAIRPGSHNLIESTVWVEETQVTARITQSKQMVA